MAYKIFPPSHEGEIMNNNYLKSAAGAIAAAAFLGACSSPMPEGRPIASQPYPAVTSAPAYSSSYGVVESIQMVNAAGSSGGTGGIGPGAVIGGVAGGVLGNQVGGGSGRTAATVAGTVGGAVIGHQIEQRNRDQQTAAAYQVGVRLDNGSYQTVTQESVADLQVGNRVRIEGGRAYRY
jgi:outer membrane lipoprotein SlyB